MRAAHNTIAADDIGARQRSVYAMASQDATIDSCERQSKALAAEHEALAVKIAEVGAELHEEGIFDRYGIGPATSWLGMIHDKGLDLPSQ